ncbi:MAG: glycogen synthase GlgA [bacterium]
MNPSIWFITTEAHPLAKTGGLGDVCGALPGELKKLGADVSVVLPWYNFIRGKKIDHMMVNLDNHQQAVNIGQTELNHVPVYLVGYPPFFNRKELYGEGGQSYPDNDRRFTLFSRAALTWARATSPPDIFHCHDWFTALVPMYLKTDSSFPSRPSVFTIHNLQYQGIFEPESYELTGLNWKYFQPEGVEYYGKFNFMKAGLNYADRLTTVSKKYSQEIQTPQFGEGLDGVLRKRKSDLTGIINGIDTETWNPETDIFFAEEEKYSSQEMEGKETLKNNLLDNYDLKPKNEGPLVGIVSRLVSQKGIDLLLEIGEELMELPGAWIILGTGDSQLENALKQWEYRWPEKIHVALKYDEKLAHRITGASDLYCMPSRFEPCGLNQQYSLNYGTVPVVRRTGGLADTVVDPRDNEPATGFVFDSPKPESLLECMARAINVYQQEPEKFACLQKNGMSCNFSWKSSAEKYLKLYRELL